MSFINGNSIVVWPVDGLGPEAISCLFSPYGEIKHLHIEKGENEHYGCWICYYGSNAATRARDDLNGQIVDSHKLNVDSAIFFIRSCQRKAIEQAQPKSCDDDDDFYSSSSEASDEDDVPVRKPIRLPYVPIPRPAPIPPPPSSLPPKQQEFSSEDSSSSYSDSRRSHHHKHSHRRHSRHHHHHHHH